MRSSAAPYYAQRDFGPHGRFDILKRAKGGGDRLVARQMSQRNANHLVRLLNEDWRRSQVAGDGDVTP